MAVTPTGIWSKPLDLTADLFAGLADFQTWTSTATSAAAKARIYCHAVEESEVTRPLLVVQWANFQCVRGGWAQGVIRLIFESEIDVDYQRGGSEELDYASAAFEHTNDVGEIIREAMRASEGDGKIFIPSQGIRLVYGPARPSEEQRAEGVVDRYESVWEFEHGLETNP